MEKITYDNLPHAIAYLIELVEFLNKQGQNSQTKSVPYHRGQNLNFYEALEFIESIGFRISKSKLYKLTSNGIIPCKHFGNRLVFNTEELLNWCESQLKSKDELKGEATLAIVNDAQRKIFNCKIEKDGK